MKLPDPVAWMYVNDDGECEQIEHGNDMPDGYCQFLYTEMQVKARLASHEAVMRKVLELLGPQAPECCGCAAEWNEAIKALEEQLK